MQVVWLSWKDIKHPQAGGAELVTHELCSRLAKNGHQVTLITSEPEGLPGKEQQSGYQVLRKGNRYTVYFHAWRQYRRKFSGRENLLVEEINTIPFFGRFYAKSKRITFFHQLAREIWFYEYFPPLNIVGYIIEPIYLRLNRSEDVIAMSDSTKSDLIRHGHPKSKIDVISEGITIQPVKSLSAVKKTKHPSILAFGSVRPMKRTMHILRAFELAKPKIPGLTLTIAGGNNTKYGQKVIKAAEDSKYTSDITVLGRVEDKDMPQMYARHHFIVAAALKEGWGLTITEAASQGTPAIAYDVDGQRDAVFGGEAGILSNPNIEDLAQVLMEAFVGSFDYKKLQKSAWDKSKNVNFKNSYSDFVKSIGLEG